MRYNLFLVFFLLATFSFTESSSQKTYSVSVFELIFSYGNPVLSQDFKSIYPQAEISGSNIRFTAFFHLEEDWHIDLTDNLGFITGFGIRNVGLSTDEVLPVNSGEDLMRKYKIVRRLYTAGVPLFLKIGSFKDHIFFYAGGECELALHYKEKYWTDTHKREGSKTKYSQWLGSQTPLLLPSLAGGVQLPGSINIKVKYYINDFLNLAYTGRNSTSTYSVSDLSRYESSPVYYISLSWQFTSDYMKSKDWHKNAVIAFK